MRNGGLVPFFRIEKILNSALKDIAKPYTKRAKKKIFKKGRRN